MWDVFISHASEDKDNLVRPLAKRLSEVYKVHVWYDEFTLEYGDSLLKSIEKGLQNSSFGVVIFSKDFFKKTWTDHEYTSLSTKEMLLNKKVIIPIWYNVNKKGVSEYSLILADKYAISLDTDNFDIDDIAIKIIKIIRPDIYDNISRMVYLEGKIKNSKKCLIKTEEFAKLPIPPIRHEKLSVQMKARLKLVHNAIKEVDDRTYEDYEEDFRRSTNIDREIIITELIIAAYIDCISIREMTFEEKLSLYDFALTQAKVKDYLSFSQNEINKFVKIIKYYLQNIDAEMVMAYNFDLSDK